MRLNIQSIGLAVAILIAQSGALWACPECRPAVKAGVYNRDFAANLLILLLPVALVLLIGFGIYFADSFKAKLQRGAKS